MDNPIQGNSQSSPLIPSEQTLTTEEMLSLLGDNFILLQHVSHLETSSYWQAIGAHPAKFSKYAMFQADTCHAAVKNLYNANKESMSQKIALKNAKHSLVYYEDYFRKIPRQSIDEMLIECNGDFDRLARLHDSMKPPWQVQTKSGLSHEGYTPREAILKLWLPTWLKNNGYEIASIDPVKYNIYIIGAKIGIGEIYEDGLSGGAETVINYPKLATLSPKLPPKPFSR